MIQFRDIWALLAIAAFLLAFGKWLDILAAIAQMPA